MSSNQTSHYIRYGIRIKSSYDENMITVKIHSFGTDRQEQTVQTHIRLGQSVEQTVQTQIRLGQSVVQTVQNQIRLGKSDQDLCSLSFHLHLYDTLLYSKITLFKF